MNCSTAATISRGRNCSRPTPPSWSRAPACPASFPACPPARASSKSHRQAADAGPQGQHPARGRCPVQRFDSPCARTPSRFTSTPPATVCISAATVKRDAGPIKETLAAAIADLGRVRRDSLVQDPFCGSGTLVIEAAQKALNLAPRPAAAFAAEHFGLCPRRYLG